MRSSLTVLAVLLVNSAAFAWSEGGHSIVGLAAEGQLCSDAAAEIARLGDGQSLDEIGLWADRIREQPEWAHSAPWHFVNIPDDGDPRRHPEAAAGDVIAAIERFYGTLRSRNASDEDRAIALRFLVHLVGDLHQPLHVGRAEDRGGNLINVTHAGRDTSLHGFWDFNVVRMRGLNIAEYAESISHDVQIAVLRDPGIRVRDWAVQVFELRDRVYGFDAATGRLDDEYLAMAEELAQQQLTLAAAHLANILNAALCL